MPKKEQTPPDADALRQAITRFTKQGDRGTALIAAAWLDDALEALIRAHFRPDKSIADDFMRSDGPCGSFSARIKLAYLLDLIDPTPRRDLDKIRAIRNHFAHARREIRFSTPSIKDRCKDLHGARAYRAGGGMLRSPRQEFLVATYFLTEYLFSKTRPRERRSALDYDVYEAVIRRTVKSSALQSLAQELERLKSST
jgi:DNA-binding MltR family transcriptional regulator